MVRLRKKKFTNYFAWHIFYSVLFPEKFHHMDTSLDLSTTIAWPLGVGLNKKNKNNFN